MLEKGLTVILVVLPRVMTKVPSWLSQILTRVSRRTMNLSTLVQTKSKKKEFQVTRPKFNQRRIQMQLPRRRQLRQMRRQKNQKTMMQTTLTVRSSSFSTTPTKSSQWRTISDRMPSLICSSSDKMPPSARWNWVSST